jgi:hypothetical protein
VLEAIGVSTTGAGAGAGVSTTTGAGAGVSTTIGSTGAGVLLTTVVVVDSMGVWVTTTSDEVFLGIRLTFVFVPRLAALPLPPAELLVYARPSLSTAAGPEITAGVVDPLTPSAFFGAGAVPTTGVLLSADVAAPSVRI